MSTYVLDEKPSEKYARFYYWKEVSRVMGPKFFKEKHLVFNSKQGFDILCLYGFGIQHKNILAVFSDPEKAQPLMDVYPNVQIVCSDVVSFCRRHHRTLGSAFLDFQEPLSEHTLETALQVTAHGLRDGGFLGIGLVAGGEKEGAIKDDMDKQVAALRELVGNIKEAPPKEVLGFWTQALQGGSMLPIRLSTFDGITMLLGMRTTAAHYNELEKSVAEELRNDLLQISTLERTITRGDYFNYFMVKEGTRRRAGVMPMRTFFHETPEMAKFIALSRVQRAYAGEAVGKYRSRFAGMVPGPAIEPSTDCTVTEQEFKQKLREIAAKIPPETGRVPAGSRLGTLAALFGMPHSVLKEWTTEQEETEK